MSYSMFRCTITLIYCASLLLVKIKTQPLPKILCRIEATITVDFQA